jgi:DNA-binding MarR family transcriptional regulator
MPAPVPQDVIDLEHALARISYLLNRARQHDTVVADAGIPVDRAAVPILRRLAESGPLRPGDLAARLTVEAPHITRHITRQIQRLETAGHVERIPDPFDRRAHQVRLTASGREVADRVLDAARRYIWQALAEWSPHDRELLATLFHRMVDDLIRHAAQRGIVESRPAS